MDKKEAVSTLNDLIETCKDGEEGFKTCAEDVRDSNLQSFFLQRARLCADGAQELKGLVRALGEEPETSSSVSGTLHRRWVDIKSAIMGKDEVSVLNECERGEDIAIESYRSALEKDLPPEVRNVVERQFHGVQQNHDQVKALRDQARAHH